MTVPLNVPPHVVEDMAIEQGVSRASSLARSAAHRSPSAVPAMEFDEMASQEEQTTSERYRSLLPSIEEQIFSQPTVSSQQANHAASTTGAIIIAVPLIGHQRDQYQTTPDLSTSLIRTEETLDRLRGIVIHPDLDNPEALSQATVEPSQQVEWDVQCSAKFRWLRELIEHIRNADLLIALAISSEKRRLLLIRFLNALEVPVSLIGEGPVGQTGLHFVVVSSIVSIAPASLAGVQCIISLDGGSIVGMASLTEKPPHIQLIVPYSVEHIELASTHAHIMSESQVLGHVKALRQQAGRLGEDLPDISTSAQLVATALTENDPQFVNSIPQLPPIDMTPTDHTNGFQVHTSKRQHEDSDSDTMASKRLKSEDLAGGSASDFSDIKLSHDGSAQTMIQQLHDLLVQERSRQNELETNLGEVQYRFEELHKQLSETEKERDAAIKTAQQAVIRMNDQADNLRTLKTGMSQLREQLAECETRLASHAVPERAEIEASRQAAAKAVEDEQKATSKLDSIRKDLTYAQTLYQDASTKAQGLAGENDTLTKQLASAEAAATTERLRLRQLAYDNVSKHLQRENKQLRTMLELREIAIRSRDEEIARLKDSNRGRMGTRGTSVPRSPRMSSPMKTIDARIGSSRHGSPAACDVKDRVRTHPLRHGQAG